MTISIDLELAWGHLHKLDAPRIDEEREVIRRLLGIMDDHHLPVTWAFVGALLDPNSARGLPGGESIWYAPDIIDQIRNARTRHDLGSHGGRHINLDTVSESEADEDFEFARSMADREGIAVSSFVFPRNRVGRRHLLVKHGIKVYRGEGRAWHLRIRGRSRLLGRAANLADKMLPLAPDTVRPERDDDLVNVPGSMLFFGRNGLRRVAPAGVMTAKLARGLAAARNNGDVFHLWFHPSNFSWDTDRQLRIFAAFARSAAEAASRNEIAIRPMSAFA